MEPLRVGLQNASPSVSVMSAGAAPPCCAFLELFGSTAVSAGSALEPFGGTEAQLGITDRPWLRAVRAGQLWQQDCGTSCVCWAALCPAPRSHCGVCGPFWPSLVSRGDGGGQDWLLAGWPWSAAGLCAQQPW